ncbi:MAG: ABC transporter permease [Candidatus Cloacimonetes bacterium]|jgi:lipopolysaccharide transport system permease protein|nr:ABC transporter permease [Candidatus Cloacimonadota bacterium]
MKEVIYKPNTGYGDTWILISDFITNLPKSWSLGFRLALRNINAKYRQSFLGIIWILFPPLATAAVWIFLRSQNVFDFKGLTIPYPVFVLIGTLLWQVFSESITILLNNISQSRSLLIKINFPHEALVFSAIFEIIFAVCIKLILLVVMLVAFQVMPSWQIIFTVISILSLMMLGLTVGLLLTPIAMLYNDITFALPIVLQFAMYLSPVVYPKQDYSGIGKILNYNPVAPLLNNGRDWIFGFTPDISSFIWISSISFLLFFVGLLIFKMSIQIIIERIGS